MRLPEAHVALVGRDLDAGMEEAVELFFHGFNNRFLAMADVEAANASGEVEVAVAVDKSRSHASSRLGDVDRRAGKGRGLWRGARTRPWISGRGLRC